MLTNGWTEDNCTSHLPTIWSFSEQLERHQLSSHDMLQEVFIFRPAPTTQTITSQNASQHLYPPPLDFNALLPLPYIYSPLIFLPHSYSYYPDYPFTNLFMVGSTSSILGFTACPTGCAIM
jgi:hypothetical protein